jgi:hypothetical protein
MAKTPKRRATPGAWFDSFPPVDPPGWDDKDGVCRRHWAPLLQIPDPAQRDCAQRLATLDLTTLFAAVLRKQVKPLPVPAHKIGPLIRALAPVCCWLGDGNMQAVVLAAIETASARSAER